jgi:serine protease Do
MNYLILKVLAGALVVAGCQPVERAGAPVPPPSPQPILMTDEAKAIKFSRLVFDLKLGDPIGEVRGGLSCSRSAVLEWPGKLSVFNEKEVAKAFRDELSKANYPVVGDPDPLFPMPEGEPELLIAGRITSLTLNYCFASDNEASGNNNLGIEWQVFDLVTRRTVLKTTTFGNSRFDRAARYAEHRLFYDAIADATRMLLADARFHGVVAGKRGVEQLPPTESSFRLHPRMLFTGTVAQNLADIQAATVTIVLPGGHGSGFFISSSGYLLTNAHVVGDAKFVRVRLSTGREIAGEVVTVNRVRDAALVKVAEERMPALPIARYEPQIGKEVFAIGTPARMVHATTVTKGIVSAYRDSPAGKLIQGDVDVHGGNSGGPLVDESGNVVGMTVLLFNRTGEKTSIGINFFIPVADALRGASVQLAEARTVSVMQVLERPIAVALQPSGPRPSRGAAVDVAQLPAPPQEAVAPAPQQVTSLVPVIGPVKRDGDYRTTFTARSINGLSYVDLDISIDGESITGVGRTRGGLQCRAKGEIAVDGSAWINVACSNAGSAFLSWQLSGRFAVEDGTGRYLGRLAYANLGGAPGEAVFQP